MCGYSHVTPGLGVLIQKNLKVQASLRCIVRLYLTELPPPPTKKKIKSQQQRNKSKTWAEWRLSLLALRRWKQGDQDSKLTLSYRVSENLSPKI